MRSNNITTDVLIFTFINKNYGSILQAFALQKYLKANTTNKKVENIRLRTKEHIQDERVFNFYGPLTSKISQFLFGILRFRSLVKRKLKSQKFINKEFTIYKEFRSTEEILEHQFCSKIYITGSDQVFNPEGMYKEVFFLNLKMCNNGYKKVAYSGSFGLSHTKPHQNSFIKKSLDSFCAIGCREFTGLNIIKELNVHPKSEKTIDPVFLLDAQEWTKYCKKPKLKNYILIYGLAEEKSLLKIANRVKKKNEKIVFIRYNTRSFIDCDKIFYGCGPEEFLGLIRNANCVITDSFHGLSFSMIFKKQFRVFISRPELGSRLRELMKITKTENNLIEDVDFQLNQKFTEPDWNELNHQIINSKKFIQTYIIENF